VANHRTLQTDRSLYAWTLPGMETWWSSFSEYQSEMFDFMSHRFAKDSSAVHELGECRNWEEVSGLHSRWLHEMSKDYSAEATKIGAIYSKQTADAVQDRRSRH
jgi:Phasin protein